MNSARAHPRFWMGYFFLSAAMAIVNLGVVLVSALTGGGSVFRVVATAFGTFGLLPLYGYVRQRKVASRWLPILVLAITGGASALVLVLLLYTLSQVGFGMPLLVSAVIASIEAPALFAMYQYAWKSPHIWNPATMPRA